VRTIDIAESKENVQRHTPGNLEGAAGGGVENFGDIVRILAALDAGRDLQDQAVVRRGRHLNLSGWWLVAVCDVESSVSRARGAMQPYIAEATGAWLGAPCRPVFSDEHSP
jgi:hypothetical protein